MQKLIRCQTRWMSSLSSNPTKPSTSTSTNLPTTTVEVKGHPIPAPRKRKQIIRMDPSSYAGAAIGVAKPSLLERRGEANLILQSFAPPGKRRTTEWLLLIQQDIDLRPTNLKRVWNSINTEAELKEQIYNPKRNNILGSDLAAAHFLVRRGGKIRFQNQIDWITKYRKDDVGQGEIDAVMTRELCTMPTTYDPSYRVEAIDASGVRIHYEGLANFENLNHVTSIALQKSPLLNDWGLDRVIGIFSETLEYLDLSGCRGISDRGLAAMWRFKNLKTLILKDLPHIQNLEIVCAHLEEKLPNLTCIGVDYEKGIDEVRQKTKEMEDEAKRLQAEEEARTIEGNILNLK